MADQSTPNGADQANQPAPKIQILTQFVRDLSFENIVARKGAPQDAKPQVAVQVNLDANKLNDEGIYEVSLKLTVDSSAAESKIFLCELDYAGRFKIENVPEDQLHPFLMIECPRMLFPFARRIVSDATRDGGFQAVNVDPIDFVSLYRQEIARRQQASQQTEAPN
ncbi:protein-export chaperone SecB [Paracoccaceae bacterium GXU_MW_L88]